eukprot:SAG22_NODE_12711_length_432_cov_0.777778_1_plen_109_part_01
MLGLSCPLVLPAAPAPRQPVPDDAPGTYQQRLAAKIDQAARNMKDDSSRLRSGAGGGGGGGGTNIMQVGSTPSFVGVESHSEQDGSCAEHAKLLVFSAASLCGCITMYA